MSSSPVLSLLLILPHYFYTFCLLPTPTYPFSSLTIGHSHLYQDHQEFQSGRKKNHGLTVKQMQHNKKNSLNNILQQKNVQSPTLTQHSYFQIRKITFGQRQIDSDCKYSFPSQLCSLGKLKNYLSLFHFLPQKIVIFSQVMYLYIFIVNICMHMYQRNMNMHMFFLCIQIDKHLILDFCSTNIYPISLYIYIIL